MYWPVAGIEDKNKRLNAEPAWSLGLGLDQVFHPLITDDRLVGPEGLYYFFVLKLSRGVE